MNHEKKTGCLVYIGDEILPSYRDDFINHCKDPIINQPVFHGKKRPDFFRGSHQPRSRDITSVER